MAKSTTRNKLTFATMIAGNIISLGMSIGFVYITLPTTLGLALAIVTGIASTYFQSVIFYNVLVLQKKAKPLNPRILTTEEIRKNKIKSRVFLSITIPSFLLTTGSGALGIYQGLMLLGETLAYPSLITLIVAITCAAVMGIGYLLAGYDQADVVYQAIKGQESQANQSTNEPSPLRPKFNYDPREQNAPESKSILSEQSEYTQRFFKQRPGFSMPDCLKTDEKRPEPKQRDVHPNTRRYSFS